jgi:pyruvate/2-oxoglutarate dehydrogenase complex dihydrolipoamide acyltransferase (E2) component
MRMRCLASVLSAFLAVLALVGCQQLFTTSLAKPLARDSIPLPSDLSASDASDLAAQAKAEDDKKLANALVGNLVAQIGAPPDPAALAALGPAAASAAITASGMSSSLSGILGTVSGGSSAGLTAQTRIDLVTTIQANSSAGVLAALDYLTQPSMTTAATGLSATDYVIAAAVVAASFVPPGADPSTATYTAPEQAKITLLVNKAKSLVTPGSPEDTLISGIMSMVNQ